MNPRTTLILLILAVAVTVVAYQDSRYRQLPFQRDLDQPFAFTAQAVGTLDIRTGDEYKLLRTEGEWQLVEPLIDRANQPLVNDLLDSLIGMRIKGMGSDRAFTRAEPPLDLAMTLGTGRRIVVSFGRDHDDLPTVYGRITDTSGSDLDGAVVLLDKSLRDAFLGIHLGELRDPALIRFPVSRISRLEVQGAGGGLVVEQEQSGTWKVFGEVESDAEPEAVRRFLEAVVSWRVIAFPEVEAEAVGLAEGMPPRATVTIDERGTGKSQVITIGKPLVSSGAETIAVTTAGRPGVLAVSREDVLKIVETPSERMRSPFLLRLPDPNVESITVSRGDFGKVHLEKSTSGGWQMDWAGREGPLVAESAKVHGMVTRLREARVLEHLPLDNQNLQRYGFDRPDLEISIAGSGGDEVLIIGTPIDGGRERFVWNRGSGGYARVMIPDFSTWRSVPYSLRRNKVLDIDAEAIFSFRLSADGQTATFDRPAKIWRLKGNPGQVLPAADLGRVVKDLAGLRAQSWLASPTAPPGSHHHRLRVDLLGVAGGEPLVTLWFSAADEIGLRMARIEGGWSFIQAPAGGPDLVSLARTLLEEVHQQGEGSR